MRNLTQAQKEQLADHIAKKPIEYIELYNELYDHYASTYEEGDENFEDTLAKMDDHFYFQRIKKINNNLLKKTKRSVNKIYWKEFKNFWRWPQIVTTLSLVLLGFILIEFIAIKSIFWYIIFPMIIFNVGLFFYGSNINRLKKIGNKRFKSAYFGATQHYLTLPTSIFNVSILLPIMALDPEASKTLFFETYPFLVLFLMLVILAAAYIGFKVVRTKIRIQYL
jgi:fumarate reductase subunit D